MWKQVALLIFSFNLLPYISADYKLIHIFIPMLLFINCEKESKFRLLSAILFGLLLIPKAYYHFSGIVSAESGAPDISISIIINPLIMLIFTIAIMYEGLRNYTVSGDTPRE
jgi:hypothetical protein